MLVKLKPCKVLASSLAPASFLLFAVLSFTRAKGQGYQSWWFFIFTDMLLHMMLVLHQLYLLPSKPSIACWWPVVGRIVAILCLPCGAFSYQGQWTKVANHMSLCSSEFQICIYAANIPKFTWNSTLTFQILLVLDQSGQSLFATCATEFQVCVCTAK